MVDVHLDYYCRSCDIEFTSGLSLSKHNDLYHPQHDPRESTLTSYLSDAVPQGPQHDYSIENLQCPKQCCYCNQVIWEVAVWCPNCRARCHRSCSEKYIGSCPGAHKQSKKPKDHPGVAKNITDLLRRKVGENKMRYIDDKYDLDLSYISPRLIAMSFPAKGVESVYRNKLQDVAELLDSKHRDNYLIINVSDRTYDISLFKNQVLEFGWPDHHAPLMNTLCCIVKTIDSWLKEDPDHVIVVHCKGGKGRTGVAIAAFIQFSNMCLTAEEALDTFAVKRFYDDTIGGVTQPSQRRMVHYFSSLIKNEVLLENRQLVLNTIILFGCPAIDRNNGAKLCFCVYEGFKHVHTTSVYHVTPDREHVYISLDNLKVQSDVMIKAFHISKTGGKVCILRVQFHTAFVKKDYSMVFRKKDVDIACRDDRFPDDGVLQLIFKPRTSVVTDTIDQAAHQALLTDVVEAQEVADLSAEATLMSFDYADFSSFFTDNPISEMKGNQMLDRILTLHDDYKLITPLEPFPVSNDKSSTSGSNNKTRTSGSKEKSPLKNTDSPSPVDPPPLPPKCKPKDRSCSSRDLPPALPPALPPRKSRPAPIPMPSSCHLVEDKDDYLSFEIATPVKDLVQHFEPDELNNFNNWVTFDEDDEDKPLIDLLGSPKAVNLHRRRSSTLDNKSKSKLLLSRSEPVTSRDHPSLSRKSKSLDSKEKGDSTSKRSSAYIPYLERKESIKRDVKGRARYIPYKERTDSLGRHSQSSSSGCSSPSFLSPPPLPPRGDKIAPGPTHTPPPRGDNVAPGHTHTPPPRSDKVTRASPARFNKDLRPCSPTPISPLTRSDEDLVAANVQRTHRRLPSLSKSMDNLPVLGQIPQASTNKVPLNWSEGARDPSTVQYSLINWERMQLKKVIKQTKEIWYRPNISRQESQATLVSQCPGAFIIRLSQSLSDSYGLTIRLEDGKTHDEFNLHPGSHKVSNFLIQKNSLGKLFINGYGTVDFESLEDLVEYFTNHTGGLPHPLKVPTQPYADRVDQVVPMLLRHVSFPVFILEKRCIRYLPLDSFAEDNVKTLLTETIAQTLMSEIRLISMSVTKHGIILTDPDCILFDSYNVMYKSIRNCEIGSKEQNISLPESYNKQGNSTPTFGLIHRDAEGEIIYIALAEYQDSGLSITKTINKFRSYLV